MTAQEKELIKEIKENALNMKLQLRVLTEGEFKKKVEKIYKSARKLLGEQE